MYLRHYDNDQDGPTFSEGGGGRGGHWGLRNRRTEKNSFKTATKIRLKPKIASKTV